MTNQNLINNECENTLVLFPAQFRVRCPRCGADRHESPFAENLVRYGCRSGDHFQSEICEQWEKDGIAKGLVADALDILNKFQFTTFARRN